MTNHRTILITESRAIRASQALQGSGFYLRGLTRKPDSERAAALTRYGVDIVKSDLDDEATLRRALRVVGRLRRAEGGGGGCRAGRGAGQASCDTGAQGRRRALSLHIRGIGTQADGRPALRQ